MNYRIAIVFVLSLIPIFSRGQTYELAVRNQTEFDGIQAGIENAMNRGFKEINVRISKGTYYFYDRHISFRYCEHAGISLNIIGSDAVLVGAGRDFASGRDAVRAFDIDCGYTCGGEDIFFWTPSMRTDRKVEVLDKVSGKCRLAYRGADKLLGDFPQQYLQLSEWFSVGTYPVTRADDSWIYFTVADLKQGYNNLDFNVNDDWAYAKQLPRFKLLSQDAFNVKGTVHASSAVRFLSLVHTSFSSVSVSGLTFISNGRLKEYDANLIDFWTLECPAVRVSDCFFSGIGSVAVNVTETDNVTLENCSFSNTYRLVFIADRFSDNIRVTGNRFRRNGLGWDSCKCVEVSGNNYYVADNSFCDFGYGAIGVGVWCNWEIPTRSAGIVENNTMWYEEYLKHPEDFTVMDSGAIYIATQNDDAVIRYNVIHDYTGMKDNRGIFCDDGASGFNIYGNVVTKIANSYTIDSRRVPEVEKGTKVSRVNVNNRISNNFVDGIIRFEGREGDNTCVKGPNFFCIDSGQKKPDCEYSNLTVERDDVLLQESETDNGIVYIKRAKYKVAKRSFVFKKIKQYLKKK